MSEELKYLWLDHSMEVNRVIMVIEVIGMAGLHPAERVCRIKREGNLWQKSPEETM